MPTRRTSVVSFLNLTEAEEDKLLEEIDDLEYGENIYLEICDEESRHFTSVTTFHGMIRIFLSRTWISLIFWVLVVCTCLVFYMIFSGQLLINYSSAVTFHKISGLKIEKKEIFLTLCNARLKDSIHNSANTKCSNYQIPLINNRLFLEVELLSEKAIRPYFYFEEMDPLSLRESHAHFLHLAPSQIVRLNSTRSRCVTSWSEVEWAQSASNQTYSYKSCDIAKRLLLVTKIGFDANNYICYPPCTETIHKKQFSSMKNRRNLTTLSISYERSMIYEETRKMTIVDVLSLLGGGTSLFLGCSCVTLMETFVFLFKLIVQGLTKSVDDIDVSDEMPAKPFKLERVKTVDDPELGNMTPELRKKDLRNRRKSTLIHIHKEKRPERRDPDEPMADNNSTNPTNPPEIKQAAPDHNPSNPENLVVKTSTSKTVSPSLGERLFPRLQRQPALDLPDEIGDQNARVQPGASFILDDFTSARGNRNILRRASTATSKASNISRARSLKLMSQVPQKRRSQIFSKHLLMSDF